MDRIFSYHKTVTGIQLRHIYINNCTIEERVILPLSSLPIKKEKDGDTFISADLSPFLAAAGGEKG